MNCSTLTPAFRLPLAATPGKPIQIAVALLTATLATARVADAVIIVAGELVVDLRASELDSATNTWNNRDTAGATVGNFVTKNTQNLNVATNISDGNITVPKSLFIDVAGTETAAEAAGYAALSEMQTPAVLEGNNTRTVEAWIYPLSTGGSSTPVGWGASGDDEMSSFRYTGGGNGMMSMWFNDVGWDGATLPTNEWVHVTWTYDASFSNNARGYINGQLAATGTLDPLSTSHKFLAVGAGREAGTDPFDGYMADVRVHTGVLSDIQVLNNFEAGIDAPPGKLCDFDGDGDCDSLDFGKVRDNLFTAGTVADGDANRDGFIDLEDYRLVKDDPDRIIGIAPGPTGAAVATPEPTTLGMGALALLMSCSLSRVKRRA